MSMYAYVYTPRETGTQRNRVRMCFSLLLYYVFGLIFPFFFFSSWSHIFLFGSLFCFTFLFFNQARDVPCIVGDTTPPMKKKIKTEKNNSVSLYIRAYFSEHAKKRRFTRFFQKRDSKWQS